MDMTDKELVLHWLEHDFAYPGYQKACDAFERILGRIESLEYAARLAADWINNDFIDVTDNQDGTSTISHADIETAHAKGEAIKQCLLDALGDK